jgi:RNA polymerase sigma-70 factor (ECF subfamily)
MEQDLRAVIRRCLDGDGSAWSELVKSHSRLVYSICYNYTRSPRDAEDLMQEVFLKLYGKLGNFDLARGDFHGWLTVLTRNHVVDQFRRSRQQRLTDSMDAGWEEGTNREHTKRLRDPNPMPDERAVTHEVEAIVTDAVARISPEMRQAVQLRFLAEMEYKEIAELLRIPEGTVKSRVSRGRVELARLLKPRQSALGFAQ